MVSKAHSENEILGSAYVFMARSSVKRRVVQWLAYQPEPGEIGAQLCVPLYLILHPYHGGNSIALPHRHAGRINTIQNVRCSDTVVLGATQVPEGN